MSEKARETHTGRRQGSPDAVREKEPEPEFDHILMNADADAEKGRGLRENADADAEKGRGLRTRRRWYLAASPRP